MRNIILTLFLISSILLQAQTKNVFLERSFWQNNPSIEVIEKKISEGNNPSESNAGGFDAVTNAIMAKTSITVVKHLLSKEGNDINKLTHDKRTYVFWAASAGNFELVQYLINKGAHLNLKDSHHFSPLTFALAAGINNTELFDLFIDNGINPKTDKNEHGANALLLSIQNAKDFKLIDYFISKGLSLTDVDAHGNGVINYAAKKGNKEIIELLLKKGVTIEKTNSNGGNAILLATQGGRGGYNSLEFFQYLEGLGFNPNITNNEGKTPLHNLASGNKDLSVFNYFISKGVSIEQVDKNGNTALMNASRRNSIEAVELLANKNIINKTNINGESALTNALSNKLEIIEFLIKNGADINVTDSKGNNLNYYLVKSINPRSDKKSFDEKLKLLSENGLDITTPQKDGNTLYHLALVQNSADLLKMAKSLNLDINTKNNDGLTPLHLAVMTAKNEKTIKYLLSIGADKSIKTGFEESVYELAKENELLANSDINYLK